MNVNLKLKGRKVFKIMTSFWGVQPQADVHNGYVNVHSHQQQVSSFPKSTQTLAVTFPYESFSRTGDTSEQF